eukprot:c13474_g1_i1.p1 GENE.c13474_g1_i1~~c13474_g1_i1.p1  ORF type:complete len:314 (+),score=32.16 c13474_g1_i1:227-1168(+)
MGNCCGKKKEREPVFADLQNDIGPAPSGGSPRGTPRRSFSQQPHSSHHQSAGEADSSAIETPDPNSATARFQRRAMRDAVGFPPFDFTATNRLLQRVQPDPTAAAAVSLPRSCEAPSREHLAVRQSRRGAAATRRAAPSLLMSSEADYVMDPDTPSIVALTSRPEFHSRYLQTVDLKNADLAAATLGASGPTSEPQRLWVLSAIDYSNRARNAVRIRRMKVYLRRLKHRKNELTTGKRRDLYGEMGEILRMEAKTVAKLGMLEHVFEQKFGVTYEVALSGAYMHEQLVLCPPEPRVRKIRADYTSTEEDSSDG